MAKWGEGDPRWIVEERADATNVNNWHWTEKNATAWSQDKLKSLLQGLKIENDNYSCEITELSKVEGEATASNRKAKLIFFYEWELEGAWKGKLVGKSEEYNGKFNIPNLSEENDADDIDMNTSTECTADEAYNLKEFMRKKGAEVVRDQLAKYTQLLKEEFSQGMILPSKTGADEKSEAKPIASENKVKKEMSKAVVSESKDVGVRIPCKSLTDKEEFKCPAAELYRALTEQELLQAFTRNEAQVEAEKGGRFVLFDGNIYGEFTELDHPKKISMRWRFKTWPDEHYSNVTLDLKEKDDCTQLVLTQTGVPEKDYDRTREGWRRYYWESIKQTFGYGARLF